MSPTIRQRPPSAAVRINIQELRAEWDMMVYLSYSTILNYAFTPIHLSDKKKRHKNTYSYPNYISIKSQKLKSNAT